MNDPIEQLTARFLDDCVEAGESEQRVVEALSRRLQISHNISREFDGALTLSQRLADRIALFGSSWTFILIFLSAVFGWVALNWWGLGQVGGAFDPYPYIFLNLLLAMVAALQAPVIMMSQNRNSSKDRVAAEHDYEVNLKAELEILALHQKLDMLRQEQWVELLAIQRDQIQLLNRLLESRDQPSSLESASRTNQPG